jgi:hypothetical protein
METIYLTDITGTIGEWLDGYFDNEVPNEIVDLLIKAYNLSAKELEK